MHQLVVHAPGDVGQVEVRRLMGQLRMKDDLEQEVTQLLLQMPRRCGGISSPAGRLGPSPVGRLGSPPRAVSASWSAPSASRTS